MPRRNRNARKRNKGSQTVHPSVWRIVDVPTPYSLRLDEMGVRRIEPRKPLPSKKKRRGR